MKKRTAIVIGGIFALVALATTGTAASTHWFGLGNPHYSQRTMRLCNADWHEAVADLAQAQAALRNLNPGTAQHWLTYLRAVRFDMKSLGCPEGPYPLRNP